MTLVPSLPPQGTHTFSAAQAGPLLPCCEPPSRAMALKQAGRLWTGYTKRFLANASFGRPFRGTPSAVFFSTAFVYQNL